MIRQEFWAHRLVSRQVCKVYGRPSKHFTASAARLPRPAVRASSSSTYVSIHNGCRLICRRTKSFFRLFLLSFFQFLYIPFYRIFAARQGVGAYDKTAFNLSQYRDFVYSIYRSFVIKRNLSFVHGQQMWKGEERKHDNVLSRLPIFTISCFPVFV
jgi:hypothetical protein